MSQAFDADLDPEVLSQAIRDAFKQDHEQAIMLICSVVPRLSQASIQDLAQALFETAQSSAQLQSPSIMELSKANRGRISTERTRSTLRNSELPLEDDDLVLAGADEASPIKLYLERKDGSSHSSLARASTLHGWNGKAAGLNLNEKSTETPVSGPHLALSGFEAAESTESDESDSDNDDNMPPPGQAPVEPASDLGLADGELARPEDPDDDAALQSESPLFQPEDPVEDTAQSLQSEGEVSDDVSVATPRRTLPARMHMLPLGVPLPGTHADFGARISDRWPKEGIDDDLDEFTPSPDQQTRRLTDPQTSDREAGADALHEHAAHRLTEAQTTAVVPSETPTGTEGATTNVSADAGDLSKVSFDPLSPSGLDPTAATNDAAAAPGLGSPRFAALDKVEEMSNCHSPGNRTMASPGPRFRGIRKRKRKGSTSAQQHGSATHEDGVDDVDGVGMVDPTLRRLSLVGIAEKSTDSESEESHVSPTHKQRPPKNWVSATPSAYGSDTEASNGQGSGGTKMWRPQGLLASELQDKLSLSRGSSEAPSTMLRTAAKALKATKQAIVREAASGMVCTDKDGNRVLTDSFKEAASIVLDICSKGPVDPSRIADEAFLLLLPLEFHSEMARDDPSARPDDSTWVQSARSVERSHRLTTSRWLQEMIDICAFAQAHRRAHIAAKQDPALKEALDETIADYTRVSLPYFPNAGEGKGGVAHSTKTINPRVHATVGTKLQAIAATLGSFAFLPFLLLSPRFGSVARIRRLTNTTLSAFSFLLRGGRPDMACLSEAERQFAEAAVFGANVVIPYALRWYLTSAARAYDEHHGESRSNRASILSPTTSSYLGRSTTLHVGEQSDADGMPGSYLPQPSILRQRPDGGVHKPLAFGLMSGYAQKRRPVLLPPIPLLTANYTKYLCPTTPFALSLQAIQGDPLRALDLRHLFKKGLKGADAAHKGHPTQPTVDNKLDFITALTFSTAYSAMFGLTDDHPDVLAVLKAVKEEISLVGGPDGRMPLSPTPEYLRSRQAFFREQPHPTVTFPVYNPPASILPAVADGSDEPDEEESEEEG
ncbi:hypothetical protein OC845_002766 [Tilletia horrida]|nr:hypothetical protein OC845_002766 [Tilletia horrida]